jgi:protein involved in polysaccharide export with SLBB domain
MRHIRTGMTALAAVLLAASPAFAQQPAADANQLYATRAELQSMLERFESGARAEGYSEQVRQIARDEADLIRRRLEEGDMQVGDQIALSVTNMDALTGTFAVSQGRVLLLPEVGAVPLAGLLRSELQDGIRDHLARFIVNPQVIARAMIRLSVTGAVNRPGYLVVPSDNLLTDVLATAGQPTGTARTDAMRILRGDDVIWDGVALQDAIIEGRTIDQLNLRAGDRIDVPDIQATRSVFSRLGSSLVYVVPIALAVAGILMR